MEKDESIVVVTADLGFGMFDKIRDTYPDRFHNVGAAEQLMLGIGVGLALEGKTPVLYSISPFLLLRPAEWIRNYLGEYSGEDIKCILIGSGLDDDYAHDGLSHHLFNAPSICDSLGLDCWLPAKNRLEEVLVSAFNVDFSTFIGLRR
jgi:transketolase